MIHTVVLNRNSLKFSANHPVDQISELCKLDENIVWVDVADPTGADFEALATEFRFHPLSIEDCRHEHQRPKVEEYQGYYFMVLYEADMAPDNELEFHELNIFMGRNYLVTVHTQPIRAIHSVGKLWREWKDLAERRTGVVAYLLVDFVVDEYLPILDRVSDRMEVLEDQIFGDFHSASIEEIFLIKKQLLFMRRFVTPLRDVINTLLRREQPIFSRETTVYFQDVYDHLLRVSETIDSLRDLLSSTMEAYLSVSGNRMNIVMKRLTAIATILMSVTLVAGIYGMNFDVMPELRWKYAYAAALSAMLVIGVSLYYYFRRIRWL